MKNLVQKPTPEEKGARRLILRVLNARVSLPTWMLALSSATLCWGALLLLILTTTGLGAFGAALPFAGWFWAPVTTVGTTLTLVGLYIKKSVKVLRIGSFLSFVMWIFGGIAFVSYGNFVAAVALVIPWLVFYAYLYLASFFRDETGL